MFFLQTLLYMLILIEIRADNEKAFLSPLICVMTFEFTRKNCGSQGFIRFITTADWESDNNNIK